jgi:hypothetical protein
MASIETKAPSRSMRSTSAGMAVISLDFSSVASWPSTRRSVVANADTKCRAFCPRLWSWLRREEENSTNQPKTRVNMTSAPWWSPASTLRTPHESSGALVSTTESFDRVSLSHLILI